MFINVIYKVLLIFFSCSLNQVLILQFFYFTVFAMGTNYPMLFIARSLQGVGSACTSVAGMLLKVFLYFLTYVGEIYEFLLFQNNVGMALNILQIAIMIIFLIK